MDGIMKNGQGEAVKPSGFAPSDIVGALAINPRYAQERCWVFGSSLPLDGEDPRLRALLAEFFAGWASHGAPLCGRWQVWEQYFLLIISEPDGTALSGCSLDSMQQAIMQIETAMGTQLLDSSRIFFRNPDGIVQMVNRSEFKVLAQTGEIDEETPVFDTTLSRVGDFAEGKFEKPLGQSWHAQLYRNARRQMVS